MEHPLEHRDDEQELNEGQEDQGEIDLEDSRGEHEDDNCGFVPLEEEKKDGGNKNKRKRDPNEDPRLEPLKQRILRLVAKYPRVRPRTSLATLRQLDEFDHDELQNVYNNCIIDINKYRGTPTADFVIALATYHMDKVVKGYTTRCLQDKELKQDVEEEVIITFGLLGNRATIICRLMNNLYKAVFGDYDELVFNPQSGNPLYNGPVVTPDQYFPELSEQQQQFNNQNNQNNAQNTGQYIREIGIQERERGENEKGIHNQQNGRG